MAMQAEKLCCEGYALNPPAAIQLQYYLFRLLRMFYAVNREQVNAPGVTALQGYVLMGLQLEGPMTMSRMSDYTKLSLSTMTRVVDKLAEVGLVERVRNESDRRQVFLRLTEAGQAKSATLRFLQNIFFQRLLSGLSELEREDLLAGLAILLHRLDEFAKGHPGWDTLGDTNANVDAEFIEVRAMQE